MRIVALDCVRHPEVDRITNREVSPSPQIRRTVEKILNEVAMRGEPALLQYARSLDGLKGPLAVSPSEITRQAAGCPKPLVQALRAAIANVKTFHKHQVETSWEIKRPDGVVLGQRIRPMHRVGLYVPGGAGVYPSTVIMNAVPALIAGVRELVAVTPCSGNIAPVLAETFRALGVREIYKIGGAQAVGLLAYGTRKIKPVDKIVGPGNVYATVAKKEVFGKVDIDMVAGPSEILVLADESADPDWVAADLLSQAEHGSGHEAALCITTSVKQAEFILTCVKQQVAQSPKKAVLQKSLRKYGRIFVVENWEMGCELANQIAPEHLEVLTKNPGKLASKLTNAGALFLGPYTTEPVGDYFAGPNHVLPTNGSARFFSPLGVYDFYKRTSLLQYSRKAIQKQGGKIIALAESEGFYHHAEAVRKRL